MRSIELKTTALELREEQTKPDLLDYRQVLINALQVRPEGMNLDEMERAVRVIGKLRQANGTVLLEEADYEFVKQRVQQMRWLVADQAVIDFANAVKNAPPIEVEPKKD